MFMGVIHDLWEYHKTVMKKHPNTKIYLSDWLRLYPQYKRNCNNHITGYIWKEKTNSLTTSNDK